MAQVEQPKAEEKSAHPANSSRRISNLVGNLLEEADSLVYIIVGVCFILGAILALFYTFSDFYTSITNIDEAVKVANHNNPNDTTTTANILAEIIITLISNLLLVLIVMEVLGTIIQYLKTHITSLTPFLGIGIISATRGVLSIGAKLSVQPATGEEFNREMIELAVNAGAILALGITLTLINRFSSKIVIERLPSQ